MKTINIILLGALATMLAGCQNSSSVNLTGYVNPFIGTSVKDDGHTFPAATLPMAMVQAGPDTGLFGWEYCAGYKYEDDKILHFSQTHLSGPGSIDLGDICIMPFTGTAERKSFESKFSKANEKASPGFYSVILDDAKAAVDITATERVALYSIKYLDNDGKLFLDLQSGLSFGPEAMRARILECEVTIHDEYTISGYMRARMLIPDRKLFYCIKFDKPILSKVELPKTHEQEKAPRYILDFGMKKDEVLNVKIALSNVSEEGAFKNMIAELPDFDFERTRIAADKKWNDVLSKIVIDADDEQKTIFYTAVYHSLMHPNNIADTDGTFRTPSNEFKVSENKKYFGTFSFWDTYRAAHALYTIITPYNVNDFVNSMLMYYDANNMLPKMPWYNSDIFTMIGVHSISVSVEAAQKGFDGFDKAKLLDAAVETLNKKREYNSVGNNTQWESWEDYPLYEKLGYYPFDVLKVESISRTLENAYNDYCVAVLAKSLGNQEVYERFSKRSLSHRNVFDPVIKFMRGKDSEGNWREPFDPMELCHGYSNGGDFTEANSWIYTWHVQHDIPWLIEAMGGNEAFVAKLNQFFSIPFPEGSKTSLTSGAIGQYVHGNEPSHHISYLFALAGEPKRTQELVRKICTTLYQNTTDGLCGNDDLGQISAWYVFSTMGFYPVNPVSAEYVFGAPQFKSAVINLADGNTFKIVAKDLSEENKYVKRILLNGKVITTPYITHSQIMQGGTLTFEMYSDKN